MRTSLTFLLLIVCVPSLGLAQSTAPAENDDQDEIEMRDRLIRAVLDEGYSVFAEEIEQLSREHKKRTATNVVRRILIYDHVDFSADQIALIHGAAISVCGSDQIITEFCLGELEQGLRTPNVLAFVEKNGIGELPERLADSASGSLFQSPFSSELSKTNSFTILSKLEHLARPSVEILSESLLEEVESGFSSSYCWSLIDKLGTMREYASPAVPTLLKILDKDFQKSPENVNEVISESVRNRAAETLGKIGVPKKLVANRLVAILADPTEDEYVKQGAAQGLYFLPEEASSSIPLLIKAWEIPQPKHAYCVNCGVPLNHWASYHLLAIGKAAVPAIKDVMINHEDGDVRYSAAECLSLMPEHTQLALNELIEATRDENEYVRAEAYNGLGSTRSVKATEAVLKELKRLMGQSKPDNSLKWTLLQSLKKLGPDARIAAPLLLRISGISDEKIEAKTFDSDAFETYLALADPVESIPLVSKILKSTETDDPLFRSLLWSIETMGAKASPLASQLRSRIELESMFESVNDEIAGRNFVLLRAYATISPPQEQLEFLRKLLKAPKPNLVLLAANKMIEIAPDDEVLRSRLRKLATDEDFLNHVAEHDRIRENIRRSFIWAVRGIPNPHVNLNPQY